MGECVADCSSAVCFLCAGPAAQGRPMDATCRADPGRGRTASASGCASAYDHEALPGIEISLILEGQRLTARPCFAGLLVKAAFQMSSLHSDHRNVAFRHHHRNRNALAIFQFPRCFISNPHKTGHKTEKNIRDARPDVSH